MKQECSVCRKFTVDTDDPLVKVIKKAHSGHHQRGWECKDSSQGGGNNIIGEVKWIRVW